MLMVFSLVPGKSCFPFSYCISVILEASARQRQMGDEQQTKSFGYNEVTSPTAEDTRQLINQLLAENFMWGKFGSITGSALAEENIFSQH